MTDPTNDTPSEPTSGITPDFVQNALQTISRQAMFANHSPDAAHSSTWAAYGYKSTLTFDDFFNMQDRFGIAAAGVNIPVDECWQHIPTIEGNDTLTNEIKNLNKNTGFWGVLKIMDAVQRVGSYGALFFELKDGLTIDKQPKARGVDSVQAIKALYESQITPEEYETKRTSPEFGKPTVWSIKEDAQGDRSTSAGRDGKIHKDRIVTWAEGAIDGGINGRSCLRSVFNSLVTLEKIIGAGGEGFRKNARASTHFNFTAAVNEFIAAMGAKDAVDAKDKFNDRYRDFQGSADGSLITSGMDANQIKIDLANPEPFFKVALNDVAADWRIPGTVLIGQQTGRLASDEDQFQLAKMATARRAGFLTQAVTKTIKHLQTIGVLSKGDFELTWPDLFEPEISVKLDNFSKLINAVSRAGYAVNMKESLEHFGIPPELVESEPVDLGEDNNDEPNPTSKP